MPGIGDGEEGAQEGLAGLAGGEVGSLRDGSRVGLGSHGSILDGNDTNVQLWTPLEKATAAPDLGRVIPLLLVALALAFAAALFLHPVLVERRRRRLMARPLPREWAGIVGRLPFLQRLTTAQRRDLDGRIQVFLAEKEFHGAHGLEVTDEMRVSIAAQASLLLLGREGAVYPNLRQVIVYPGAFIVERLRPEPSGVVQEQRQVLAGESHARGEVVLSWESVVAGAADAGDGRNVVLHEFAHQLDQLKGHANGAPAWLTRSQRARWAQVMGEEYARLHAQLAWGQPTLLDPYAATDPAEFFAVATEHFFEQPELLAAEMPRLFAELRGFYRLDLRGQTPNADLH
jgi:Mlc titration factor MtfA (ptsG expression regulator)